MILILFICWFLKLRKIDRWKKCCINSITLIENNLVNSHTKTHILESNINEINILCSYFNKILFVSLLLLLNYFQLN